MNALRTLLLIMFAAVGSYTIAVAMTEGPNLIPEIATIATIGWRGQFHADFLCYLLLSALWVAWRHQFTAGGIVLAVLAANLGILFLSIYLIVISFSSRGRSAVILLGPQRADAT